MNAVTIRDPRIDPQPGDVLRKWDLNFLVTAVVMGRVLFSFPGWSQGILFYRRWAADAEVKHISEAKV